MLYRNFLKKIKKCPFCYREDRFIFDNKTAFLTYSLAPYSDGHLLVIPKRHVVSLLNLTEVEKRDISNLVDRASEIMGFIHCKNYSILVREGKLEKSIDHLHYHIIPDHRIGDLDTRGKSRRIMTEKEIDRLVIKLNKFK